MSNPPTIPTRSRRDYTGQYVGRVRPDTWAENRESLLRGRAEAVAAGDIRRIALCDQTLAKLDATGEEAYNASLLRLRRRRR